MVKLRFQIALPEDPFRELEENWSADKSKAHTMPQAAEIPQIALAGTPPRLPPVGAGDAEEQQVALLQGARAQQVCARARAAHLESQVAKLRLEKLGLTRQNEVLADLITRHAKEHEAKLAGLLLKHDSERVELVKRHHKVEEALVKQNGDALAEAQRWKVAMEGVWKEIWGLDTERKELRKKGRSLRKERDAARAEARGWQVDLARAQQRLKRVTIADLEAPRTSLAICCAEVESVRKENESVRKENESVHRENENVRKENESVRKESESVRKENERLRKDAESVQKDVESFEKEADALWEELERVEGAKKTAIAEAETAEGARARARTELEAAVTRLVESQQARAGLQRELADALAALDGVKRHHATGENMD
ncbi:hypothetical protein KFL_002080160 [Klebsormidium nitens]|uniref:Uncharacterized protein n=1 Tax=Klebsormidium nitens TaxID=105231 RepID=A0A1Y1I605_KLENI|nr:hypothetical protein KFL_002080160 [Klebsormidium nitens]|eukprot:GAQ84839.1 hypothetical protein KFL_002080160 [Klebsormidium nitens]